MTGPTVRYTVAFGGRAPADEARASEPVRAAPPPSRAARMLALAHHIEQLIDEGVLSGYAEAARALGVTRARMTQVMDLLLLAPDVQEGVLMGLIRGGERALRQAVRQVGWADQLAGIVVESGAAVTRQRALPISRRSTS